MLGDVNRHIDRCQAPALRWQSQALEVAQLDNAADKCWHANSERGYE
jgi:hypothetical protein